MTKQCPERYRRAEFRNTYGELFVLTYDFAEGVGLLTGDEFGDEGVEITDGFLPGDFTLDEDEHAWMAETWELVSGEPFRSISPVGMLKKILAAMRVELGT